MQNFHTQSGGLIIGGIRITFPFAKISVNKEILIINYLFWKKIEFTLDDISNLEASHGLFDKGIIIHHKIKYYEKDIIFRCSNPDKLIEEIKNTGFFRQKNND